MGLGFSPCLEVQPALPTVSVQRGLGLKVEGHPIKGCTRGI